MKMKDPMTQIVKPVVHKQLCENTYQALNLLLDNSYAAQKYLFDDYFIPNEKSASHEICTIKLCTARSCGHTRAAARAAFERFNNVLFLAPKEIMVQNMFKEFLASVHDDAKVKKVTYQMQNVAPMNVSFDDGSRYVFCGLGHRWCDIRDIAKSMPLEAVFVDCTNMASQKKIDEIYMYLGPIMTSQPSKFFVFME